MTKQEIRATLDKVQDALDGIGGDASFLFVAKDDLRFAMGGVPEEIEAGIVIAMLRYPLVKQIIDNCVNVYKTADAIYGEEVRNSKPDHLIEKYINKQ